MAVETGIVKSISIERFKPIDCHPGACHRDPCLGLLRRSRMAGIPGTRPGMTPRPLPITAVTSAGAAKSSGMPHTPSRCRARPEGAGRPSAPRTERPADSRPSAAGSTRTRPARSASSAPHTITPNSVCGHRFCAAVCPGQPLRIARLPAPDHRLAEQQADHEDRGADGRHRALQEREHQLDAPRRARTAASRRSAPRRRASASRRSGRRSSASGTW